MSVSRSLCAGVVLFALARVADAQLSGLPGSGILNPWQTGVGYFTGPYFAAGLTSIPSLGSGVFCINQQFSLQYGYPWSAFLATSPSNVPPGGYSNAWLGAACLAPSQSDPYAFGPIPGLPIPGVNSQFGTFISGGSPPPPTPSTTGSAWQNINWIRPPPTQPVPPPLPPVPPVVPPVLEPHVTPEPATWLLLGSSLLVLFGFVAIRTARL